MKNGDADMDADMGLCEAGLAGAEGQLVVGAGGIPVAIFVQYAVVELGEVGRYSAMGSFSRGVAG